MRGEGKILCPYNLMYVYSFFAAMAPVAGHVLVEEPDSPLPSTPLVAWWSRDAVESLACLDAGAAVGGWGFAVVVSGSVSPAASHVVDRGCCVEGSDGLH